MIPARSILVAALAASYVPRPSDSLGERGQMVTIQALQLSDTSVTGGTSVTAAVLTSLASVSGDTVSISSFPRGSFGHPAFVIVPKGSTQASFTLTTTPTATTQLVTVIATSGASQKSASLTIRRPAVRSLSLTRTSVQGGDTLSMTVALDGVAPAGGIPLTLTSALPGVVYIRVPNSLPGTIVVPPPPPPSVPAGATQAVLPLGTTPRRISNTIPVTVNGQTVALEIRQPSVNGLAFRSDCNSGNPTAQPISGPRILTAYVSVRGPISTTDGAFVSLTSNPASAQVPSTVEITHSSVSTVPSGIGTATVITPYDCFTINVPPVTQTTTVTLIASAGGVALPMSFTIVPLTLASFSIPVELARSGSQVTAQIVLSAPAAPGGSVVTLTSSNPGVAAVPASVTVPANAQASTLPLLVNVPSAHPDLATGVIITASFAGRTVADTLIVRR